MRMLVSLFICLISIFSFSVVENRVNVKQMNNVRSVEYRIGQAFEIPDSVELSDPERIYPCLERIANELQVNFFRQQFVVDEDNQLEIRKDALITSDTQFFNYFQIIDQKDQLEQLDENEYLSTQKSNDTNQIGTIKNKEQVYVGHLKQLYNSSRVKGIYFVELPIGLSYDMFLQTMVEELNQTLHTNFVADDFRLTEPYVPDYINEDEFLEIFEIILVVVTIVLIVYMILNQSRKIGIYNLFGFSNIKIWLKIVHLHLTGVFLLSTVLLLIFALIRENDNEFILRFLQKQLVTYVILTLISVVPLGVIASTNIYLNLKNKEYSQPIFVFNSIIKGFLTYVMIAIGVSSFTNIQSSYHYLSSLKNWEKGNSYGVFYPLLGGDNDTNEDMIKSLVTASTELYHELNSQGAILINARDYEEDSLILNQDYKGIFSIRVNPNYLKEFPLYDELGNQVVIDEQTKDRILLVQAQYKEFEREILDFFEENQWLTYEFDQNNFSKETSFEPKEIKIIWLKNNQSIFSFNPDVYKEENNMISDTIVEVITEYNSFPTERWGILGGGSTDPLKVKLIDNDPQVTMENLTPLLKELNLDSQLKYLVPANELALDKVKELQEELKVYGGIFLIDLLIFSILLLQNISIHFNKYKKEIVVKRLYGFGYVKAYRKYWTIFLINWVILLLISVASLGAGAIFIVIGILLIEAFYSLMGLNILEKRNKLYVIKGE